MIDWEQQANRGLQSLGDAYQRGQIDREQYRARRRLLLQGIGERRAVTQPNAVQPSIGSDARAQRSSNPKKCDGTCIFICAIIALGLIASGWLWWAGR